MKRKLYDKYGHGKLMTRLQTWRQLEQWHECGGIHVESEQCANGYEYQHWVSRRQELQAPPEVIYTNFWPQEWWLTTVATSVHDDLPFALSWPVSFLLAWPNKRVGSEYSALRGLSLSAAQALVPWIS